MHLDHIFIFTNEHEKLTDSLKMLGLSEGTPNVHSGQGTACNRFFFQNSYIELVWVRNEVEIKSGAISKARLWERSQYHLTNYCPFGLCIRDRDKTSNAITLIFEEGWRYYSAFLPLGQFANIASNENFSAEPMLFEMPFFTVAPKDYACEKQQPLRHKIGFKEITKISLTLPSNSGPLSPDMKKVLEHGFVKIIDGKDFWVDIEFDNGIKEKFQDFYPLAPLTLKW